MTGSDAAFLASMGVVLVAVWAESMVDIARSGQWRRRLRDLAAAGLLAVLSLPAAAFTSVVAVESWPVLHDLAPRPLIWATGLHPTVAFTVAFVLWDGLGWADHWFGHHTRLGWFTHRPHHGGSRFDLTLALRQSPLPLAGIALLPLLALSGVSLEVTAVAIAVSNLWQALIHTEANVPEPPWLSAAVMTPATHRLHHDQATPLNLGPVLTVWDRLARTLVTSPLRDSLAENRRPHPGRPGHGVAGTCHRR